MHVLLVVRADGVGAMTLGAIVPFSAVLGLHRVPGTPVFLFIAYIKRSVVSLGSGGVAPPLPNSFFARGLAVGGGERLGRLCYSFLQWAP